MFEEVPEAQGGWGPVIGESMRGQGNRQISRQTLVGLSYSKCIKIPGTTTQVLSLGFPELYSPF